MNSALLALIMEMSARDSGADLNLLTAVCEVESGLNPNAYKPRDGSSPSYGLCQIKAIAVQDIHGPPVLRHRGLPFDRLHLDLRDPYNNARYAGRVLHKNIRKYSCGAYAVARYNAGHLSLENNKRTKNWRYVEKVYNRYEQERAKQCIVNPRPPEVDGCRVPRRIRH